MTPTVQQQAFLTALTTTTSHLALVARAGCGKTSTILLGVDAARAADPSCEVLVCAFNKAIADEVSGKLKKAGHTDWKYVQAQTLHALGMGLVRQLNKNVKVSGDKVRDLVERMKAWQTPEGEIANKYGSQIVQLVGLAKQAAVGFFPDVPIGNVQVWHDLADHFDVNGLDETDEAELVVEAAQKVYKASLAETGEIDFDDMILYPLIKNLRVRFTKDLVFLDEAQDLSRARQALARKFMKPNTGRMIVVGDDRQAIYGFTGADAAALDNLIRSLGATRLPLSVTWRCPAAVVTEAQMIVPDIQAAEGAPMGAVRRVGTIDDVMALFTNEDAILCRNTAPLIQTAYKLIRAGIPCKVEGRAIGEGLIKLARRWKVATVDALLNKLDTYEEREVQKALAKGNEQKMEAVQDMVNTLREIIGAVTARGFNTVNAVIDFINDLFGDDVKGVMTLATYHRSKGREFPNVYLFEHFARCPSRAAKQDWQIVQEHNLSYVAITRAMKTLTYIG